MQNRTPQTLVEMLASRAALHPDAVALLAPEAPPIVYGRLLEAVGAAAGRLREAGVARGDRVALVLPNGSELAVWFLAAASVAAAAPLNPAHRARELEFSFEALAPRALVVDPAVGATALAIAEARGVPALRVTASSAAGGDPGPRGDLDLPARPEDVALVLQTSGTTARPKLVPLTHRNLCASIASFVEVFRLSPEDRCLNVMPFFHIQGLWAALLSSLASGGSVVCTPGFEPARFLAWLGKHRPTWYTAAPTIHQAVLRLAHSFPTGVERSPLRFVRSAAAPFPVPLLGKLESALRAPVIEAYGMTEIPQICSNSVDRPKPGTVGRPAGPEVAIVDARGEPVAPGATGEPRVRGASVFAGYLADDGATADAFADGWLRTGDQGRFDADGYLTLTGRIKEQINQAGEKISPREVEEALLEHPGVVGAVVFALPHRLLGESVGAAVVTGGVPPDERELRRFVADRLAHFKVPRRIAIVDDLPTTAIGKLERAGLAERLGLV